MLKRKKLKIIFIAISIFGAFFFFRPQLARLFRTDFGNQGYYYSRQFGHPMKWINTDNLTEIGAALTEDERGMSYKFPKKPDDRVILKILFGKPEQGIDEKYRSINYLEVLDNAALIKKFNYSNLPIGSKVIELSRMLSDRQAFNIRMGSLSVAENKYDRQLAIRRIEVSVLPPEKNFLPNLSLIFPLIIMPFIFFECFAKTGKIRSGQIRRFLFLALLIIAIHLRWQEVERLTFAIPNPDAGHVSGISYRDTADKMRLFTHRDGFYAAKYWHEPFYPFLAKVFFAIFGSSDLHLRFVSFIFSVLVVVLTYLVGKRIFRQRNIALISCAFITFNNFFIEQAAMGLRLELESCLLLLLFYFCYLKREELNVFLWILISGIIGGFFLLTKSCNIPIILFIFAYAAFSRHSRPLKNKTILFVLVTVLAVSLYLPYKINAPRHQIVSLSGSSKYTTEFANIEFKGHSGFPRERVSLYEYYFRLHTPAQFIGYHLAGAGGIFYFLSEQIFNLIQEQNHLLKIFLGEKFRALAKYPLLTLKIAFFSLLFLFSILFCLRRKDLRLIIYIIIIGNLANLFLYGATLIKGVTVIETQRTIAHVLPFVAFVLSYSIYSIFSFIRKTVFSSKKI